MVAGKTGTAQKVNPNGKGYVKGAYIASFAGFIPANNPRFVIYVAVDSPKKSIYGSTVAGPVFSRIASYAVRKEGIAPLRNSDRPKMDIKVRDLASRQKEAIQKINDEVAHVSAADLEKMSEVKSAETVPNLLYMTSREVLRRMSGQDVTVKFKGTGLVKNISPEVGEKIPDNKVITVTLE
jgi:cell division protein FtsI (penicillin-binding protein 3)